MIFAVQMLLKWWLVRSQAGGGGMLWPKINDRVAGMRDLPAGMTNGRPAATLIGPVRMIWK